MNLEEEIHKALQVLIEMVSVNPKALIESPRNAEALSRLADTLRAIVT